MKIAHIVPIDYDPASISDYHLILAHEVLGNEDVAEYYQRLGKEHTILLDNSVVELGEAVGLDLLKPAWEKFPNAWGVVPDALADSAKTIQYACNFVEEIPHSKKLMCVAQGSSVDDWLDCLRVITAILKPACEELLVGIPRIAQDLPGGREHLFLEANRLGYWAGPWHLLGIQHTIDEVLWAREWPNIWGVDSSLTGRAALAGMNYWDVQDLRKIPDLTEYDGDIFWKVRYQMLHSTDFLKNGTAFS